jgi:hypothetical protein
MRRIAFLLALWGCGKDDLKPVPAPEVKVDRPVPSGPAVAPTVTSSITFVVPKDKATWAELSFPCYRAVIELQPGTKPSEAFYKVSPLVEVALHAADIDIDRGDFAAIGGWECGGGTCMYIAANLRQPEKIGDMLRAIPNVTVKEVAKDHYTFDAPGANGARSIHVRSVPIRWPDKLPSDAWSTEQAKATHVVFLTGVFGKGDVDPLTAIADGAAAAAHVADAEGVLADAHGRCVVGTVGGSEFKPGFKLDHARFAMAAPPGAGDPLTRLLGSNRTLDVEVELSLVPAAKEADVARWIVETKAWMTQTLAPVKAQFAGQGPVVDAYVDMLGLVVERGFTHRLAGPALTLSWQTKRVPQSDLAAIETRLGAMMSKTP